MAVVYSLSLPFPAWICGAVSTHGVNSVFCTVIDVEGNDIQGGGTGMVEASDGVEMVVAPAEDLTREPSW